MMQSHEREEERRFQRPNLPHYIIIVSVFGFESRFVIPELEHNGLLLPALYKMNSGDIVFPETPMLR